MARALEKDVRPVPLLVYNSSKVMIIAEPWRGRPSGEALYATEGRILTRVHPVSAEDKCRNGQNEPESRLQIERVRFVGGIHMGELTFGTQMGYERVIISRVDDNVHAVLGGVRRKVCEESHWSGHAMLTPHW